MKKSSPKRAYMYYETKEAYDAYRKRQRVQVHENYKVFCEKHLPKLLAQHRDKFALLRDGEVVDIFDNRTQASDAGSERFDDFVYSVQEITDEMKYFI